MMRSKLLQKSELVNHLLTLEFFAISSIIVLIMHLILLLPIAIVSSTLVFQRAFNGHRNVIWIIINTIFVFLLHIKCVIMKHLPIPSIIGNLCGFISSFVYIVLFWCFIMWFTGGTQLNRSTALIIVIHLLPAWIAHVIAALLDQWRLNCIIPHVVYAILAIAMVIITLIYDPWNFYVTVYCAVKAVVFYLYAYVDGQAFINGINKPSIKWKPIGMMVYSLTSVSSFPHQNIGSLVCLVSPNCDRNILLSEEKESFPEVKINTLILWNLICKLLEKHTRT